MEWIPVVFVTFKVLVLATGMFFAIKWHYDQGKKGRQKEARAVLRASAKVAALFIVLLVALGYFAFGLLGMLGNDLTFP